eukprot:5231221-Karenia_brevis.AAC.1
MIKYRGPQAREALEAHRHDGGLSMAVPGIEGRRLHVVQDYKHLGTWVSISNNLNKDANYKEQQAMAAYSPLACRIFGTVVLKLWLKT